MPEDTVSRPTRAILPIAYHTLAAAALLVFAAVMLHKPVWALDSRAAAATLAATGIYWLAAVISPALGRSARGISGAGRLATSLAAAVLVFAVVASLGPELPRVLTLWVPLLGLALSLMGQLLHARLTWTLIAVPAALLAAVGLLLLWVQPDWLRSRERSAAKPAIAEFRIRSSLYDLRVTSFKNFMPRSALPRGGLALLADRYLLVSGDGQLVTFRPADDMRSLEVRPLAYKVPMNAAEFDAASRHAFVKNAFRIGGIAAQQENGAYRVYISHHYWKSADRCWVMRVSSLEGSLDELMSKRAVLRWKTAFETRPCMPLSLPGHPPRFGALESGGRLAWLPDGRLLVTIGDHSMDGWNAGLQAAQDPAYSFGKIIAIDLDDGSSEIYSSGHRNAQGLAVSGSGQVWSTEHGPEGGDELNLIEKGGNYGWPIATYGTQYGTFSWPLVRESGTDGAFVEPYFSWVPSIGVSCVSELESPRFERWRGDLLACGLRDQAFWRLRVREGRVVLAERFPFGQRIRDVIQGHDGSLVVWSDDRAIHFIAPADLDDGVSAASIFRACANCHVAPAGGAPPVAPSLVGIVGRKVASDANYEYSPALRALRGSWTRERLDAFIADAAAYAPGTTMTFGGIRDAQSRKALIDYLASPDSELDLKPDRRTRVEAPQPLQSGQ